MREELLGYVTRLIGHYGPLAVGLVLGFLILLVLYTAFSSRKR